MRHSSDPTQAQSPRRKGIQSVEVGLRILEALAELGEASSLKAIALASDVSGSQAHRHLSSLIASGMVRQDVGSGRYDLGPAALKLGLVALARMDAFKITDDAIAAFVRRAGWTVQIAALGPLGPTIVRWHMGRPALMTSFNVGSVLPLLSSATGLIFLSFASRPEIDALLTHEMARTGATEPQVEALRTQVQRDRSASVEGSLVPGLRAVAYPIFDLQGRPILCATALSSQTPESRRTDDGLSDLAETCRAIGRRLGWQST